MKLAFSLFNYFPFGGLERNFMASCKECIKRGHSIDVYTMHWEGISPDFLNIISVPIKGLSNHGRAQNYVHFLEKHLDRNSYDLVVGFNKIPNLDIYYNADVCYEARVKQADCSKYS